MVANEIRTASVADLPWAPDVWQRTRDVWQQVVAIWNFQLMSVDGRPEYHFFGWTTPGYVSGEWLQARKTQAEMVRLLYVATTRA